jgi:voltage-gated potassium channel
MRNSIESLDGHNIVCGFGRIGQRIAEEFKAVGQSVVIIENDPLKLEHMQADGWLGVEGDGGDDNALIDAKVKSASRLIAATGSDATNLMISLSARTINLGLFIVARADDAANEQKLLKARANRVVPIYRSAGRRMVQLAMRPNAVEFTDIALGDHEIELSPCAVGVTVRRRNDRELHQARRRQLHDHCNQAPRRRAGNDAPSVNADSRK